MKKLTVKKSLLILLTLLLFASIGALCYSLTPEKTYAAGSEGAYAIKYDSTSEFTYKKADEKDYVNEKYCTILQTITDRYDGIYGKNAIKRDATGDDKKIYQLYFRNAFETGKTYEMSFWAKFVSPNGFSFLEVVCLDSGTKERKDSIKNAKDGEWIFYTFKFSATATHKELTRFILTCKNFDNNTAVYLDEFHVYEAVEKDAVITGDVVTETDWTTTGNVELSGFTPEKTGVAYKLNGNAKIKSRFLEVPASGLFRIDFAYATVGSSQTYFGIEDVSGNVIVKEKLTDNGDKALCKVATEDLSAYRFVKIFFQNDGEGEATVGLIEATEHLHTFVSGGGYPKQDFFNCSTTKYCSTCEMEIKFVDHEMEIVAEATCNKDGRKECRKCHNYSEVIPATGKHVYATDSVCSPDNERVKITCTVCGTQRYLWKEHNYEIVDANDETHIKRCTRCMHEESVGHDFGELSIIKNPTETETGLSIRSCKDCNRAVIVVLSELSSDSDWTAEIIEKETCEKNGTKRYTLNGYDLFVDETIYASGHDYEEIPFVKATCLTAGKSSYHKCRVCGKISESDDEIITYEPLGHSETEWITEVAPTTSSEGLQRKYCSRCNEVLEERVVPVLNDKDYDKYLLEDPETTKGYYYRYTNEYGTFVEFEPKPKSDKALVIVMPVLFAVTLSAAITAFIIITKKGKKSSDIESD